MISDFDTSANGKNNLPSITTHSLEDALTFEGTPFLKDHGFQDITVLPGSVYLELAAQKYIRQFGERPTTFRDVSFDRIFLVPKQKSHSLTVHLEQTHGLVNVYFNDPDNIPQEEAYAKLVITHDSQSGASKYLDIAGLQDSLQEQMDGEMLYSDLLKNGNQYGPLFKVLGSIAKDESQALAEVILTPGLTKELSDYFFHPVLMDACVQVLAAIKKDLGKTFILKGYHSINVFKSPDKDFYCHAIVSRNQDLADIKAYDTEGNLLMEALGVTFEYLENNTKPSSPSQLINVAATFTADPVKESLVFWGDKLGLPFSIDIAPYNQVFQQLLDPTSLFYKEGLNVIALNLEDWADTRHSLEPQFEGEKLTQIFDGKELYRLPNGLEIAHLNKYETEYVFTEIFLDKSYLKHGITLNDGDVVFDIGANIGLFTLFVNQQCNDPHVYSFEPSPQVYELLEANARLYGRYSKTFNVGVSDKTKEAEFTFYEKSSVFSSFNADEDLDRDAIRAVVHNMVKDSISEDPEALEQFVDEMMKGRTESKNFTCQLISISEFIDEQSIDCIDLLKVDAEKSELEIINGIRDEHWNLIKQIVLEVHDTEGSVINEIRTILTNKGFEFHIEEETYLHNSGLFNIFAVRPDKVVNEAFAVPKTQIEENINTLLETLSGATKRTKNPFLLISCPPSPGILANSVTSKIYNELQNTLMTGLQRLDNVYGVDHQSITRQYPVEEYFDQQQNELGHIPYTEEYFSAMGSVVARKLRSLKSNPFKVIALDCDNTLWKGVVGEDGVEGIVLSEGHLFLQEFMRKQVDDGMLICLVSKNNERDVKEVFSHRADMLLTMDNIVSTRINWEPKSENLTSLAKELNLGLDSFIFLDDNPMECAEVKANCPGVMALQVPSKSEDIGHFLKHVWAFDHLKITEEDRLRTKMYHQNIQREQYRNISLTLEDFIKGLNLQISLNEYQEKDLPRISQLTQRTNQFNFTTVRRSEADIQDLIESGKLELFTVRVSDRFGDYGLVGLAMYSMVYEALQVDTMLLSCRVLGKGVEHQMIRELGEISNKKGYTLVRIPFSSSNKNEPALKFLRSIGSEYEAASKGESVFDLPTDHARELKYQAPSQPSDIGKKGTVSSAISGRLGDDILQEIANELNSANGIIKMIKASQESHSITGREEVSTDNYNEVEKKILQIWQKVLDIQGINNQDNFFEIGGTSLKGVQVIAMINNEFQRNVSIVSLFENPTISSLSEMLNPGQQKKELAATTSKDRGKRRRSKKIARRRSRN